MSALSLRGCVVVHADGLRVALPDLDVAPGERVAVVGPNGSGKSTLVRVLAGVQEAAGTVVRSVPLRATRWVAQRPWLFRGTAADNVALALLAEGIHGAERARRTADALAAVGATEFADQEGRTLSEGQAMRVAVARALVARPALLLLDETLAPLDADGARRVAEAVLALPGAAVVAASPTERSLEPLRPTRIVRVGA